MNAILDILRQQGPVFAGAAGAFPLAAAFYGLAAIGKGSARLRQVASALFLIGFCLATAVIAIAWVEAGRPPFKTLYESLLLFAWCVALIYLLVERFYRIAWFGMASAGMVFLLYGYALMKADVEVVNLPAALQSVWFVPHVVVYFIGYGALFLGFVAAILYLARPDTELELRTPGGGSRLMSYAGFMHLAILFGFVMLTAGLIIGALWAKAAWGDYWVWDPKENWALVSWLFFLIYLHMRRTRGYDDATGAVVTIVGFAAIVFTYLGMQLLPTAAQSAHVYQ